MRQPPADDLHLAMLANARRERRLTRRLVKAWSILIGRDEIYGLKWGDPDTCPPLRHIRDTFLLPHVHSDTTVVEIGPGGGRWTRYMLHARRIYAVDPYPELLAELRRHFDRPNIIPVRNNGSDFPGITDQSVDFIFSFGVFVHLEKPVIADYLRNMRRIIRPGGTIVLQYSDKAKPLARINGGFTENSPEDMRAMATELGYRITEEDTQTLWHSAVIALTPRT